MVCFFSAHNRKAGHTLVGECPTCTNPYTVCRHHLYVYTTLKVVVNTLGGFPMCFSFFLSISMRSLSGIDLIIVRYLQSCTVDQDIMSSDCMRVSGGNCKDLHF